MNKSTRTFSAALKNIFFSLFQLVDEEKSLVMTEMEKLVALCQHLQMGAKTPVQGKTATFQKVPMSVCVCPSVCIYLLLLLCTHMNKINDTESTGELVFLCSVFALSLFCLVHIKLVTLYIQDFFLFSLCKGIINFSHHPNCVANNRQASMKHTMQPD